jgi:N-acetyl-gamma-glutamyl-phosphate reductase
VRLLARHPHAHLTVATGSQATSTPRQLPRLAHIWDGEINPLQVDTVLREADVVFLALPEAASAEIAPVLIAEGRRVIDLSGAFRLTDEGLRRRWYPKTGSLPEGTVYGLTERTRRQVASARLVSNPGCFPTAALLALGPLVDAGLIRDDADVVIDAKSGVSGAGKAPSERTHFSENHGSVAAYSVFAHRHTPEMEQTLGRPVTFVPHLVPLDRGILTTVYAHLRGDVSHPARRVADAFETAYASEPFVRLATSRLPEIKDVVWTNFCDIGWVVDEPTGRVVVVSAIDNLIKGAAGSAVQNFNVLVGVDERSGL